MYHSVTDDPSIAETVLGGIAHSQEVFRRQMEVIARHYQAVSLDDVWGFVKGEKDLPSRAAVVTFDDGYADNYQAATEILDPMGIPGAFYVAVDCVDRQVLPWPALLRYAILTSTKPRWVDPDQASWSLSSEDERYRAFAHASDYCCKLTGNAQAGFVESVYAQLETIAPDCSNRFMMSWDELRFLSLKGHTVGSHTMSHPNAAQIPETELRRELFDSKSRLEQELGAPVSHFSYPCPALQPHWSEKTVIASQHAGYATAVTTDAGIVCRGDNPLTLHRVRPSKTVEGLRWNLERAFVESDRKRELARA